MKMPAMEAFRNEDLDGIAQQFEARIAKQLFGARVDQDNAATLIDDDHGVGRRLQQRAKLVFRTLASGNVADGANDHGSLRRLYRAEADLDRELAAVLAQTAELESYAHGAHARVAGEVAGAMAGMFGA